MLLSMTGFGEARCLAERLAVSAEVRCINSRYFKLSLRTAEGCGPLEPKMEAVVRRRVRRGTIQVNLRVERTAAAEDDRIDVAVLEGYRRQLEAIQRQWGTGDGIGPEVLLGLPGVIREDFGCSASMADDWPLIGEVLESALEQLDQMRRDEGQAMAADLKANCDTIAARLEEVRRRAPLVVEAYRTRLAERLERVLAEIDVRVDAADLLKEVSLFADRSDISEEIVRLESHLEQFAGIMAAPESSGRKLDFLTQEMVRETNTIGSKANDVEISRQVIEIKAAIERIREMVQNIE